MNVPLYDTFEDYDRFVHWERRLAHEMPFLERQLAEWDARRVLDAACGTGQHALALARRGYEVTGADLSAGMIERARANAVAQDGDARFVVAGFGSLAGQAGDGFDALLCLGSSLPHAWTDELLSAALDDFGAALRPGGLLLFQNRNFDAVMANRERSMKPLARRDGEDEWLFLRFYDFNADGTLTFHVLTVHRDQGEAWSQRVASTRLRPWLQAELLDALRAAGFRDPVCYGDMTGAAFDPQRSANLVVVAAKGDRDV